MRALIVTDVFPPGCDGSGWSTFHLAQALRDDGHEVRVVKPEPRLVGIRLREYDGIEVRDFGFSYRDVPYLRNVLKSDLLAARLERFLVEELDRSAVDVVHAQHLLSAPPAVAAGRRRRVPVVVTVRDHWPICYFTTWHVAGERCPECSFAKMLACMRGKSPRWHWAGVPLMPYMRHDVRRRQRALRGADAVIAVSRYIADQVVRPLVDAARVEVIPNFLDVATIERISAEPPSVELPERFWLFAGKLDALKGAHLVLDAAAQSKSAVPLVVVGDGPERAAMTARVRREGLDVRFLPWLDNREVWRVMRRAEAVVVPSLLAEALSRTVLESMAAGTCVVATDSGGIHDQIRDGEGGFITAAEAGALARRVEALLGDPAARQAVADRARAVVRERFDRRVVVPRVEALYARLAQTSR
jgi:glycosyltransferase involved in cell wall biosynthesis